VFYLEIVAVIGALLAVVTGNETLGWSLALLFGLVSQLLSRVLFYALPVQRRYVAAFR